MQIFQLMFVACTNLFTVFAEHRAPGLLNSMTPYLSLDLFAANVTPLSSFNMHLTASPSYYFMLFISLLQAQGPLSFTNYLHISMQV